VNNANHRSTLNSLPAVATLLGLAVLVLVAVHVRAAHRDIRTLNRNCNDEASVFRTEAGNLAAGSKIVGYASHYNLQRHQCLVAITSSRPEDHGLTIHEQIFEPNDGTFVASCERPSGAPTAWNDVIVIGAPVPPQQESVAQAWFNDLMKK
jgi:hypothetical protein